MAPEMIEKCKERRDAEVFPFNNLKSVDYYYYYYEIVIIFRCAAVSQDAIFSITILSTFSFTFIHPSIHSLPHIFYIFFRNETDRISHVIIVVVVVFISYDYFSQIISLLYRF